MYQYNLKTTNYPSNMFTLSFTASRDPLVHTVTFDLRSGEGKQTKRILGIIPNFRAVSVDTHLPPQTPKGLLACAGRVG